MDLPLNTAIPTIMHVDLNSCFATAEQQAYPNLRGKAIVVAAYTTDRGCVLSPSIEAKCYGIKTGMTVYRAKKLCPFIIVRDPDPKLVRHIHLRFRRVLQSFSPFVYPKSIDEMIIDFSGIEKDLVSVGYEVKRQIRKNIGEWIRCNIGISTNRFLAKLAASLHKPDGLDVITHRNIREVYKSLRLIDLPGINTRFQLRLNLEGIYTPASFLGSPLYVLKHKVFKSVVGYYWYKRLRGWEVDDVEFERKSFGQSYVLLSETDDAKELSRLFLKLCEKMRRRLRRQNLGAFGVHIALGYSDSTYWQMGKLFSECLSTLSEFHKKVLYLLSFQPEKKIVRHIGVSCFSFVSQSFEQLTFFEQEFEKNEVQLALDVINDRFGEFTITPALMMGMKDTILDRIAFGSVKEIEGIYTL